VRWEPQQLRLELRVIPSASRDIISGWLGDALKVKVKAPPEKGRANKAVENLLSKALDLPPSSIRITAGESSSCKQVELDQLSESQLHEKLSRLGIDRDKPLYC
jgi:uncharacterized protein (TIGR00251 family)